MGSAPLVLESLKLSYTSVRARLRISSRIVAPSSPRGNIDAQQRALRCEPGEDTGAEGERDVPARAERRPFRLGLGTVAGDDALTAQLPMTLLAMVMALAWGAATPSDLAAACSRGKEIVLAAVALSWNRPAGASMK